MDIIFGAFFTNSGAGVTGLTVTIDVVSVALADATEAQVVTAGSMTGSAIIDGLYLYRYAAADPTTYTYFARANTAGTADQADLPAVATMVAADTLKIESADPSDTINAAADTALADYDAPTKAELDSAVGTLATQTSVNDLPTNAELATALGTADDATLAAIAALNNLSAAQVAAELATYDAPTFAELDARTDAIDSALVTIAAFLDTEVAAILAKTNLIPAAPAAVGDVPTAIAIADALLGRSVANVEATAGVYTLAALVLAAFESAISGTAWTIKRTDGTTTFATRTVATDAAADPIVSVT